MEGVWWLLTRPAGSTESDSGRRAGVVSFRGDYWLLIAPRGSASICNYPAGEVVTGPAAAAGLRSNTRRHAAYVATYGVHHLDTRRGRQVGTQQLHTIYSGGQGGSEVGMVVSSSRVSPLSLVVTQLPGLFIVFYARHRLDRVFMPPPQVDLPTEPRARWCTL